MKKFTKRILALILVLAVGIGGVMAVAAATDPAAMYDGSKHAVVFENFLSMKDDKPDLFTNMKDLMPGDTVHQTITVGAKNMRNERIKLYLRTENPNEDYTKLMSDEFAHWIEFTVKNGEQEITSDLSKGNVLLGEFTSNGTKTLDVTMKIALEAGNELQDLTAEIDWVFVAEVIPVGSGGGNDDGDDHLNTDDHYSYLIGYQDGTLRPYGTMTRGEAATVFFRMLTDEAREKYWCKTNSFRDVPADMWCNNAISTLENMGIIDGYRDGTFQPYGTITRAQFTKMAVNFFETTAEEYKGYYPDVPENAWFAGYVEAATRVGLIEGFEDGTFRPNDEITRAQACLIINRALDRVPHEDYLLDEEVMVCWPDCNPGDWYYADMMEATNSHDYVWKTIKVEDEETGEIVKKKVENWTKKLEQRDWAALERIWSEVYDAPGGEVVK